MHEVEHARSGSFHLAEWSKTIDRIISLSHRQYVRHGKLTFLCLWRVHWFWFIYAHKCLFPTPEESWVSSALHSLPRCHEAKFTDSHMISVEWISFIYPEDVQAVSSKQRKAFRTAFRTKPILIGNFRHRKHPSKCFFFFFLLLLLVLETLVKEGAGCTVALQLSTVGDFFSTESSGNMREPSLGAGGTDGEGDAALSICGEEMLVCKLWLTMHLQYATGKV